MKRFLSMMLTLALIFSLIPVAFAADATNEPAGITVKYDFMKHTKTIANQETTESMEYENTYGFWKFRRGEIGRLQYRSTSTGKFFQDTMNAVLSDTPETNDKYYDFYFAFEIYVPASGMYNVTLNTFQYGKYGSTASLFIIPGSVKDSELGSYMRNPENKSVIDDLDFCKGDGVNKFHPVATNLTDIYLEKGKHVFAFANTAVQGSSATAPSSLICVENIIIDGTPDSEEENYVPMISNLTSATDEETGVTTVNATAAYMSDATTEATDVTYSYAVADEDTALASVDAATGVVTGLADGIATIIATATASEAKGGLSSSKSITVNVTAPAEEPEEDKELTDAFDDAVVGSAPSDYIAPSVTTIEADGIVGTPVLVSGGAYKITAAEKDSEKGNFLYWKKAMTVSEKIVSFEREFNYVPESEGRNILVAVYEDDISLTAPKCYNANGQYLPDATPVEADLPSMAGYGKAYKWEQYKNTNVYVAQYEAETPIADIDVTVIGDNTSGGGTNLGYGAEVTCTATGENFKCWKKTYGDGTAKIVSTEAEYTFNAWEDCTVTAIYEEHTYKGSKMKIIIDSFAAGDEIGVMAEFLGFDNNVVEKGIMFGNNRIAMTTVGNQFSVIADEEGTYKGYAIVEESDGLKLITDGSYTK